MEITFCRVLVGVGLALYLFGYFDLHEWAERQAVAIKDMLLKVAAVMAGLGHWLWNRFLYVFAAVGFLGMLVKCTTGGVGPEAYPYLNIIGYPVAVLGTGAAVIFVLGLFLGGVYLVLEVLANTRKGILMGIGAICAVLGFVLNC